MIIVMIIAYLLAHYCVFRKEFGRVTFASTFVLFCFVLFCFVLFLVAFQNSFILLAYAVAFYYFIKLLYTVVLYCSMKICENYE